MELAESRVRLVQFRVTVHNR